MSNPTIAEQITALEAELVLIKAQMASASAGAKSYTLGDLSVTGQDYKELRAERTRIEKSLQRLYRGGRGFVVDMSFPPGGEQGDTSNTTFVNESP